MIKRVSSSSSGDGKSVSGWVEAAIYCVDGQHVKYISPCGALGDAPDRAEYVGPCAGDCAGRTVTVKSDIKRDLLSRAAAERRTVYQPWDY